ncbi:MAG TPA: efflux RND transporter periplasmic adaptor subunit [Terriglobia bacterium]|nr:efflux RND transporter periplasmic adaptor subunit [Terriglobia bacterium]
MKNYRPAFLIALAINIALAAGLAALWWRGRAARPATRPSKAAMIEAEPTGSGTPAPASPPPNAEAALVPVQLTPERMQSIGVKTGTVGVKSVRDEIRVTGNVESDETRLAYVQVRFPGWIQKVFADSTYLYIRKGQPLFTIYSPDLVTTEQEYLLAKRNGEALAASTVPGVAAGAVSLVNAAAERLKQWQVPAREIAQLERTGEVRHDLEIDSPVSGYITERNALPNLYVQPETRLYTVADLSTVWVYAAVFQNDIGRIKAGDSAIVTVDAYPGRSFSGRVDTVWPQVDMATRTVRVRLVFSNPSLTLKPGMFVNVRLEIPMGRQLVIPATGVFQSGTREIVFVDRGGGTLEPREVTLGPRVVDEFIVLKGVKAGERIVTSANFLIDSESQLQAAMGAFAPPPPGAGAAAAMSTGAPQATVDLSTDPSPLRKGENTFRVKLTGADGAPVTGAEVTVTLFMPAMPAMGMSAMSAKVTLGDKGAGLYEGKGTLQTGGTWQVTIVAQRNGQTLARKQLSLTAEGGM